MPRPPRNVSATRSYPNLSEADVSLVPKVH